METAIPFYGFIKLLHTTLDCNFRSKISCKTNTICKMSRGWKQDRIKDEKKEKHWKVSST
uniref:Uncharacterized protein n=1 Tax=Nelumbo nucifera TaxID=4432 RepID=A0A822ZUW9_NELNU|nr:TPA_asm: hypothetical protein HUJ06_003918 [Nelumbo nucifera]